MRDSTVGNMGDADPVVRSLARAVQDAVRSALAPGEQTVLFSGGLDSTLLAALVHRFSPAGADANYVTIGIEGAKDLALAASAAGLLGLHHTPVTITPEKALDAVSAVARLLRTDDPVLVGFSVPLWLAAKSTTLPVLLSGQGADELFGGYARYATMDDAELRNSLRSDVDRFLMDGAERDRTLAAVHRKELRMPYIDPMVVDIARAVPARRKVAADGTRKAILREVARSLGLPEELAARPKKAAQYGSGIHDLIEAQRRPNEKLSDTIRRLAVRQI